MKIIISLLIIIYSGFAYSVQTPVYTVTGVSLSSSNGILNTVFPQNFDGTNAKHTQKTPSSCLAAISGTMLKDFFNPNYTGTINAETYKWNSDYVVQDRYIHFNFTRHYTGAWPGGDGMYTVSMENAFVGCSWSTTTELCDWDSVTQKCIVPTCNQPESHPCDFYDPNNSALEYEKNARCRGRIEWNQTNCQYQHADGCITSDGYSGPFGGYLSGGPGAADLGKTTCILGCEYVFDEYIPETGSLHSSITNLSCGTSVAVPSENYVEEIIETDDSAWAPDNDLDSGTNCGEFNGEYICVDSIDDGQCVTTPGGSYFCVSPPAVIPDTPVPLTPGVSIRIPGDDLNTPDDDRDVDLYPKPPAGTVPLCPSGSTYVGGRCVQAPLPDGSCPTGYTKYGDQCVLDKDLGGPFSGPSGGLGEGLGGPPDYSYYDSLLDMFDSVRNSPLLDFSPNCSSIASCPTLSVLGTSTRIHCDLAEEAVPIFNAFLWLVAGLVAIRAVFSA